MKEQCINLASERLSGFLGGLTQWLISPITAGHY
jgi:hypothetical protein